MSELLDTLLAQVKKALNEGIVEIGGNYIRTATGQIGLPKSTFTMLGWSGLTSENVQKLLNMARTQLAQETTTTAPAIVEQKPLNITQDTNTNIQIPSTELPINVNSVYDKTTTQTAPVIFSLKNMVVLGAVLFLLNEV